jgi:V8-like Glu-specific endopeptidase
MNDNPSETELLSWDFVPQVIIDGHPLVPVPDPTAQYYRCHGMLVTQRTVGVGRGSGTLIAAGTGFGILTCAHVLFDPATGGPGAGAEFSPAMTEDTRPYGTITVEGGRLRIPQAYIDQPERGGRNDYAVVRLTREQIPADIGPLATMQPVAPWQPATVQVTGYPNVSPERPNPAMYYSRGVTLNDPAGGGLLRYNASTRFRSSGSAVCQVHTGEGGAQVPNLAHINAVHVAGYEATDPDDRYNWGVYLTSEIIQWVTEQVGG